MNDSSAPVSRAVYVATLFIYWNVVNEKKKEEQGKEQTNPHRFNTM